jgi:hypothetical protein
MESDSLITTDEGIALLETHSRVATMTQRPKERMSIRRKRE